MSEAWDAFMRRVKWFKEDNRLLDLAAKVFLAKVDAVAQNPFKDAGKEPRRSGGFVNGYYEGWNDASDWIMNSRLPVYHVTPTHDPPACNSCGKS